MAAAFDTFAEALESVGAVDHDHARDLGYTVCGVYLDENTPRYFMMEIDSAGEPIEDPSEVAFQIRNGRSISEYERWALSMAKSMRGPDAER